MSKPAVSEVRSVVIEREIPHAPEKIWRALTQPHLIAEWLMKNDFKPAIDHRFKLTADWGAVDCRVLAVEPNKTLSYTWAAYGLES
ncbi:MAG TPA: SRPBCC domain-containing protein, partial [Xanthobacteraceae bacterium]|nr:SRPBCC domain-containing protein [Xanthobacteraceae bacterium]